MKSLDNKSSEGERKMHAERKMPEPFERAGNLQKDKKTGIDSFAANCSLQEAQ